MKEEKKEKDIPFFRTWNEWYTLVIGFLIFEIAIFSLLTFFFR